MVDDSSWKLFGKEKGLLYSVYDKTRRSLNLRLVDYILKQSAKDDLIVLEAGSGPAEGSIFMSRKKRVKEAIALDHDKSALNANDYSSPKFFKVVGDLTKLPFPDKHLDVIWNSSTMEHLDDDSFDIAVKELYRVLKDDGYIFIGVPYKFGPLGLSIVSSKNFREWVGKLYTKKSLEKKLPIFRVTSSKIYFFGFFIGLVIRKKNKNRVSRHNF
jgi:ubiquinone/menaquinone biosynthesis C-methylase UbiE